MIVGSTDTVRSTLRSPPSFWIDQISLPLLFYCCNCYKTKVVYLRPALYVHIATFLWRILLYIIYLAPSHYILTEVATPPYYMLWP